MSISKKTPPSHNPMEQIFYKGGYKYQLAEVYKVQTTIKPAVAISTPFIRLDLAGVLTILKGYAWDGPSGPTVDTKSFMRGSLVHDALYELMRKGFLDPLTHRITADKLLRQMCKEDGMYSVRAWWVYHSVRKFGYKSASKENKKKIIKAP